MLSAETLSLEPVVVKPRSTCILLDAWRESPLYSDRERAALAWTEALTLIAQTHAPDEAYQPLKEHFRDDEIVKLTLLITTINAWNRIAIGFRSVHPVGKSNAST